MAGSGFLDRARSLGVGLGEAEAATFALYRDLILAAAERFNLTAVRDPEEVERRHFLEALAFGAELERLGAIPPNGECRVIDIGSGAGLPGIPLKLAWPALRLSLLESNQKRCRFLRETIERLGLSAVEVLEGRAEVWARRDGYRDAFDLAVARAVAPLPVLIEYALPFLRPGACLAANKGSSAPREIEASGPALRELGGEVEHTGSFQPPGGRPQTLILVRKLAATPERYPRRSGIAAKRPIT